MDRVISNIKILKAFSLPQRDGHVHALKSITVNTLEIGKRYMRRLDLVVATRWIILDIIFIIFSRRILVFILLIFKGLPIKFRSGGKLHVRRQIIVGLLVATLL
jgi:hypothetical protein